MSFEEEFLYQYSIKLIENILIMEVLMNFKRNRVIVFCVILSVISSISAFAQASTGSATRVFPYWNRDPRNNPRVQEMAKLFTGYFDVRWQIWTLEEMQKEQETLKKIADQFNNLNLTNSAVAITVHTQLYNLSETDYQKQIFAVIVMTGYLNKEYIPLSAAEHELSSATPLDYKPVEKSTQQQ